MRTVKKDRQEKNRQQRWEEKLSRYVRWIVWSEKWWGHKNPAFSFHSLWKSVLSHQSPQQTLNCPWIIFLNFLLTVYRLNISIYIYWRYKSKDDCSAFRNYFPIGICWIAHLQCWRHCRSKYINWSEVGRSQPLLRKNNLILRQLNSYADFQQSDLEVTCSMLDGDECKVFVKTMVFCLVALTASIWLQKSQL